jgi:hypothetical protein
MHKFKNSLMTLGGLLALIGVIAILTPFKGYSQKALEAASDVNVVNTTAAPVLSKIVNATSSPANVLNVESIAPRVYRSFPITLTGIDGLSTKYIVPAGNRLVIEHVSVNASAPIGNRFYRLELKVLNSSDALIATHYLPTSTPQTLNALNADVINESLPLRLYVDAGYKVQFTALREDGTGTAYAYFNFSGYLVRTQ